MKHTYADYGSVTVAWPLGRCFRVVTIKVVLGAIVGTGMFFVYFWSPFFLSAKYHVVLVLNRTGPTVVKKRRASWTPAERVACVGESRAVQTCKMEYVRSDAKATSSRE